MPLSTITRRGLAALLATGLVATGALLAPTASAAPLAPSSTVCTTTGTTTTCDLYAKVGSVSLPTGNGAPQPVTAYPTWSYAATATDPAGAVGPFNGHFCLSTTTSRVRPMPRACWFLL